MGIVVTLVEVPFFLKPMFHIWMVFLALMEKYILFLKILQICNVSLNSTENLYGV